jgi:hypothetical protein
MKDKPQLPLGWSYPDAPIAESLDAELRRELTVGHLLDGCEVRAFAWRDGATDDVLFQHLNEPERFTVIHLTWLRRTEIDAKHPSVEFDGSFSDFVRLENRILGLDDANI